MLLSAPKPIPKGDFDYFSSISYSLYPYLNTRIPGINHADEMLNFWGPVPSPIFNLTEITLSKRMLQLWTTFAKYG